MMSEKTTFDDVMQEVYAKQPDYRSEYLGCRCTCKDDGKILDWCMIHGLVVYADLVWLAHTGTFLPVKNKAVSRDEASLRVVPENLRYPKCNCQSQGDRPMWLCPVHGPRAICNCREEWHSDHFCPTHGQVQRADLEDFTLAFEAHAIFDRYCEMKTQEVATEFLAKNATRGSNKQKSPCDDCKGFPDDCRENCPMKDQDLSESEGEQGED
jgi:hypothetical protein